MWTKLDDNFPDHPKVLAAGACGAWLYVCGLCYSNRYLTDGHIPTAQVRRLADIPDPDGTAERLVEVGLWEQVEGGYKVHDFHDFNMDAESARKRREEISRVRSEAGKKGMASRWADNKITNAITKPITDFDNKNGKNANLAPVPTSPRLVERESAPESDNKHNKTITPNPLPVNSPIKQTVVVGEGGYGGKQSRVVPVVPPQVKAEHDLIALVRKCALELSTEGRLTKRHLGRIEQWFTQHKNGLTPEIVNYAADEAADHTGGDCLDYFFTVMANRIENPNGTRPGRNGKTNGNGHSQGPPDGYSWEKDDAGRYIPLGGDPRTGKLPYGARDPVEANKRHREMSIQQRTGGVRH